MTTSTSSSAPALPAPVFPNAIETASCGRCGGFGHYSYCQSHGTVCFKCGGSGKVYTKRGRAAFDFLVASRSRAAKDIVVGQLVRATFGSPVGGQVRAFGEVTRSEAITPETATSWSTLPDGSKKFSEWLLEVEHPKFGKTCWNCEGSQLFRVGQTAAEKVATFKAALAYQLTLTKKGVPAVAKTKKAKLTAADRLLAFLREATGNHVCDRGYCYRVGEAAPVATFGSKTVETLLHAGLIKDDERGAGRLDITAKFYFSK